MEKYNISVIVPVYNGEKYIKRCLDSIVNQTMFKRLQVIVVDDGSTDDTLNILRDYEKNHKNIIVLNIPNAGVSNARNVGIEAATGDYIAFVDSDDWIDCDCYEKMYSKAMESGTDIIAAGFYISDNNKDILKNCVTNCETKKSQKEMILDFLSGKIDVHCIDKIFSRKIVEKVRFETGLKTAEDRLFLFETFLRAQTMYCMPDIFYHYYQNENSVMHNKNTVLNMDGIVVSQMIQEKTALEFPDLEPYAEAMYISMACRMYCELVAENRKENSQYVKLESDIKKYKLSAAIRYMSMKHWAGVLFAKISPKLFNELRKNTFIRFVK